MEEKIYHIPVLLAPSVDGLDIRPDGTYVDVTFGGGGHSREILGRLGKRGRLVAFDQDADAHRNKPDDARLTLVRSNFAFIHSHLRALGIEAVDGVLADLGVSSHHFDTPERGFSFRYDAPLDMRMNQNARTTAADLLNTYDQQQLAHILGAYGELERPMRIAQDIINHREAAPLVTIADLQNAVARMVPKGGCNQGATGGTGAAKKFYAKLFQALRIEVNREMETLEMMLDGATRALKPGGRLSVITYHSLEDRIVKNFLRGDNERDFFGNSTSAYTLVNRKPIEPTAQEIEENPRSRSARLRVAERVSPSGM